MMAHGSLQALLQQLRQQGRGEAVTAHHMSLTSSGVSSEKRLTTRMGLTSTCPVVSGVIWGQVPLQIANFGRMRGIRSADP